MRPHFHARYGDYESRIAIDDGIALSGDLPPRALRLVLEWRALHREELARDRGLAGQGKPLERIAPLE